MLPLMWFSGSRCLSWLKDEQPVRLLFFLVLSEFCCGCGGGYEGVDIYEENAHFGLYVRSHRRRFPELRGVSVETR